MSDHVTIYDIAKAVGTSTATISKALNGRHDVSETLRNRVIEVAARMGYRPNVHARGLKMKQSWLVGIVYGEGEENALEHPLFLPIMNAFKTSMEESGYELLFLSQHSRFVGDNLLSHASSRQVDGLLLMNIAKQALDPFLAASKSIPMVSCDAIVPSLTSVLTDNADASAKAVRYLYDAGHRKIAHIGGPSNPLAVSGDERAAGYHKAMQDLNLRNDAWEIRAEGWTPEDGRKAFLELITRCPDITAVYCAADFYVMGLLQVCRERHISIPEDLSVIGFDDVQWTGFVSPGFSTFRQDKQRLGSVAAQKLLEAIHGESEESVIRIPAELIVRGSCKTMHATEVQV